MKSSYSASEFRELIDGKKIIPTKKGLISNKYEDAIEGTTEGVRQFTFYDLPKISLNKWYAGIHWSERSKVKNKYHEAVPTLTNVHYPVEVDYDFYFKGNPLDSTNAVAMCKLIEDVLFDKNDAWDKIWIGHVRCFKGDRDTVIVTVRNLKA